MYYEVYEMIPLIYALAFLKGPENAHHAREIEDWCAENDISTHSTDSVAWVPNDGNPLWKWLVEKDLVDSGADGSYIAIFGT